ncbi:MAG: hypothetical protein HZB38_05185 [Planctomycetes bacterium]|nr:hypothetical protein [Planctomycetota bacterium]
MITQSRYRQNASPGAAWAAAWIVLLSMLPAALAQQPPGQNTSETLDRVMDISLPSQTLEKAIRELSEKTSVPFEIAAGAADFLPYGAGTRVSITLPKIPLRRGLTQVFEGLGLRMDIQPDRIRIVRAPFLNRLGRRLTVDEQKIVHLMARLESFTLEEPPATVEFRVGGDAGAPDTLNKALAASKGANALQHLEQACDSLSWVWRVDGRRLVIERRRDDFARRLEESVSVNYAQQPLETVVRELLERANVPLLVDANALAAAGVRRIDLVTRRSIADLLELLCRNAALEFEVTDQGFVLRTATNTSGVRPFEVKPPATAVPGPKPDDQTDTVELLLELRTGVWTTIRITRADLPADLRESLEKRMKEVFGDKPPHLSGRPATP